MSRYANSILYRKGFAYFDEKMNLLVVHDNIQ